MKALTLTQPWATLIALGAKKIETRSWGTGYRGLLAIHAAKNLKPVGGDAGLEDLVRSEPFSSALQGADLPLGRIVTVMKLVDCQRIEATLTADIAARFMVAPTEEEFGDYTTGRRAWLLNAYPDSTRKPAQIEIECRGGMGLWDVPPEIESRVLQGVLGV